MKKPCRIGLIEKNTVFDESFYQHDVVPYDVNDAFR
jgi:hypothetical protein